MFNKILLDKLLSETLFNPVSDISLDEYRSLTIERLKFVTNFLHIDILDLVAEPDSFLSTMNTLHLIDGSLAIAFGVNFGLYGGSLINFCSDHNDIDEYIDNINIGEHIGCLAITEVGHGSNLKKLSTTAIYNKETRSFSINTPNPESYKCWIGNAKYATHCVMLAKLIIGDNNYDLHPFLIDLHSPGITIVDNGYKNGLNGVGNCVMIFDNVVIPEINLLGKFGFVKNGEYIISDKYRGNNRARFGDLLSTLSGGRLVLSSGAVAVSMQALLKTYHYGQIRRQFNFNTLKYENETPVIMYPTFFSGLFLSMVKSRFLNLIINYVREIGMEYYFEHGVLNKDIHILTSAIKILGSELSDNTLRMCRTLCAGNGYLYSNGFGSKFNDIDIYKTFEGDNTLLRLEVAGYAIEKFITQNNIKDSTFSKISYFIRQKSKDIMFAFRDINIRTMDGMIEALRYCEECLCVEFLNKIKDSKGNYVTTWNKNLLLIISIANIHLINLYIRIVNGMIIENKDKYFLRYFILNCLKDQTMSLVRLGLLSNSHVNDIETMINNTHSYISKILNHDKSYSKNYFELIFSDYFEDIGTLETLTTDYSNIFTISYPGDMKWIDTHIPAKL